MQQTTIIEKYQLGRTIGEGTFAKVKVATNMKSGQMVAVKIIDKQMIMERKLMYQVKREIKTMKLLHHPNIVKIFEVLATKTKIYIIMEYISGGQLSDKLTYLGKFSEADARKYFQQLIDAVDYCHGRGVYHRDLKPENLLLDRNGNLKVSDFGLSILRKPDSMLSTSCGSPSYTAPEVLGNKSYDGSAADVWSCGVILYELLAGYLPFEDQNIMNLYKKIIAAQYSCPRWFTGSQRKLIFNILDTNPKRRMKLAEIIEDEWFQTDYEPSIGNMDAEDVHCDDVDAAFDSIAKTPEELRVDHPNFINAFQLIAMSTDLDLSGLFKGEEDEKDKRRFGSRHTVSETMEKIEAAARDAKLLIERTSQSKIRLYNQKKMTKSAPHIRLSAEIIEVTPTYCMVEISKSTGEVTAYTELCKNLSAVLKERQNRSSDLPSFSPRTNFLEEFRKPESSEEAERELQRGYSSS